MKNESIFDLFKQHEDQIFYCGGKNNHYVVYAKDQIANQIHDTCKHLASTSNKPLFPLKIKKTSSLKFEKIRTLEAILKNIPHEKIIFDPTLIVSRSKALVTFVKEVRLRFPKLFAQFYFNYEKRKLHFTINLTELSESLIEVQKKLELLLLEFSSDLSFLLSISLSDSLPKGKVIAIDCETLKRRGFKKTIKKALHTMTTPLLIVYTTLTSMAHSATETNPTLPAVSTLNSWIGGTGNYFHDPLSKGWGGFGELNGAIPLNHSTGAQLHGEYGSIAQHNFGSIDGYLFWRDPNQGLLGPHLEYNKFRDFEYLLYGGHAEKYYTNLTLVAEGGAAHSDRNHIDDNKNTGYGELLLHWYAEPDLRLHVGAAAIDNQTIGEIGVEFQPGFLALPGLSVFADGGVGKHDLKYADVGIRYYFGTEKPLVRRHREDNVLPTLDVFAFRDFQPKHNPQFHS